MSNFQEKVLDQSPTKPWFARNAWGETPTVRQRLDYSRANTQDRARKGAIAKSLTAKKIPEEELEVLTKLYFREYEDCGRKQTSLKRMIKYFRETQEKPKMTARLITFLKRK